MLCPLKFGHYEFEGGQDCIGTECGMFKRCNADYEITEVEFDALDEHAQALERENEELRKLCGANDTLAAENDVSAASVDANDGDATQDSREKLEVDALTLVDNLRMYGGKYAGDAEVEIIGILDRQAAITEREWIDTECAKCGARENERDGDFAELQAKVDELTAERDKLRDKVRHQSRQLTDTQNALENRNEEIKPRWKRDTKKLQNKIDELTSELTAARRAHAQAEHDADTYREKLGRVLDMVQEMERVGTLVDQEGNVIG